MTSFVKIRELLNAEPTKKHWRKLTIALKYWQQEEEIPLVLDYMEQHLEAWPDHIRHIENLKLQSPLPLHWPLTRSLKFSRPGIQTLPKKLCKLLQEGNIRCLEISDCRSLRSLEGLEGNTTIESLTCSSCIRLEDIEQIESMQQLQTIHLIGCKKLQSIQSIQALQKVKEISLRGSFFFHDLFSLSLLPKLQTLSISFPILRSFPLLLEHCSHLKHLVLYDCYILENLQTYKVNQVRSLHLHVCSGLKNLQSLANFYELEELFLSHCSQLKDITTLSQLPKLSRLTIQYGLALEQMESLISMESLCYLSLVNCSMLQVQPQKPVLETKEEIREYRLALLRRKNRGNGDVSS